MISSKLFAVGFAVLACLAGSPARAGETDPKPVRPAGVPAGAEAWLVLPAPKASIERAKSVVEAVAPGMGAGAVMWFEKALSKFGGEALDPAKPLVAVFSLGEKAKRAVGVSLKADGDALRAMEVLFGKPTKTAEGISTYLEVQKGALPDKEVYAAVKGGRLVIGDDLELVKLLAATAAPAAGAYAKDLDAVAGLDFKAVAANHKKDIDELLKKLEAGGEGAEVEADAKAIVGATYAGMIRSGLKEVRQAGAELRIGAEEVSLAYGVEAVPGGELAKVLAKLGKAKLPSVKALPKNAIYTVASATDPEAVTKYVDIFQKTWTAGLAGGDEKLNKELKGLLAHATAMSKHGDGTTAAALVRRGNGLCAVAISGFKDPTAARAESLKAIKVLRGGAIAGKLKEVGLTLSLEEKHRKSGELEVDRLSAAFKPPAGDDAPADQQETISKLLEGICGLPVVYEQAFSKKAAFIAAGKEAPKLLDEVAARVAAGKGDNDALAATLKRAPEGAFSVGEFSIIEYSYFWIDMVGRMAPVGAMPEVDLGKGPDKKPVTFWMVAEDGKVAVRYNVPVEPIKKIAAAWRKAREDMMKGVQPPVAPGPLPGGAPGVEQF